MTSSKSGSSIFKSRIGVCVVIVFNALKSSVDESEWVIALPFSCGIYLPASYLSGRIDYHTFMNGFISLAIGGILFGLLARFIWKMGLRRYGGTGA